MDKLNRLNMIQGHILGNLTFPHDTSLSDYVQRGPAFNKTALHDFYYEIGLEYYKELRPIFEQCPSLRHTNIFKLTKAEKRKLIIEQLTEMKPKLKFDRKSHADNSLRGFVFGRLLFSFDMAFCVRLGVHSTLYIDSLLSLGTEKHIPILDKAFSIQEIGCFAMTELGHGSNVGGIATTATFIPETREFEINTPNSLATKWWIGAAGQTAVKSTVFAQLYVGGKNKGVHAFVIDIREKDTHKVKNGIIIGDCGGKFELDGIDNGFIIFKNYRVPYDSLLDGISQIDEKGHFISKIAKKEKRLGRMLSSLIRGRTSVTSASEANLKNALTIGIRWAAIRKQFGPPEKPEVPILDYQLTRNRLVPHLANLFAINASCEITFLQYDTIKNLMTADPECNEGVEFHAVLSAFKVLTSDWCFAGIHECRKICGGIGYSSHSRLGELLAKHDVNMTWEGDNYVLLQQTSAFIVKQVQRSLGGKKVGLKTLQMIETDFTTVKKQKPGKDWLEIPELIKSLKILFNFILHKAMVKLQDNAGKSATLFDAWNLSQPSLQNLGRVFGIIIISERLAVKTESLKGKCAVLYDLVSKMTKLFIVDKMLTYVPEMLANEYFNRNHLNELESVFTGLCGELGESSARIIDAIAEEDFMFGSCIGRKDGQAYQSLANEIESQPDCYQSAPWIDVLKKLIAP